MVISADVVDTQSESGVYNQEYFNPNVSTLGFNRARYKIGARAKFFDATGVNPSNQFIEGIIVKLRISQVKIRYKKNGKTFTKSLPYEEVQVLEE